MLIFWSKKCDTTIFLTDLSVQTLLDRKKLLPPERNFEFCSVKVGYIAVSGTTDLLTRQCFMVNHDLRFPGTVGISPYLEHSPCGIKNLISFDKLKQGSLVSIIMSLGH